MPCRNWLTKFTAVIQRQSWYSIVRRNPAEIVQYVQYRNAPQHNTNANSHLYWLLTTSFNADDCSSCVTSNPLFYILLSAFRRRALPFRVLTRTDCPVSPNNATGGQIVLTRGCDAWLIDCKWPLPDINSKPTLNEQSGASTKLQLSWKKLVTTLSGVAYTVAHVVTMEY